MPRIYAGHVFYRITGQALRSGTAIVRVFPPQL